MSRRKADQEFSWLKGDKGAPDTKNTTSENPICPTTGTWTCPTDNEQTRGCSGC